MKTTLLLLLIGLTTNYVKAQQATFEMFVSGSKTVTANSNFDSVVIKQTLTEKEFWVSDYQWYMNAKGMIYKGNYPADRERLRELKAKSRPGDIIFIEIIRVDNGRLLLKGQFAFTFE